MLAETVWTESVSVSIAKAFDFFILLIQEFRSFLLRIVSYFPFFFGVCSSLSLFIGANSNSLKILSSSSWFGFSVKRSSNFAFKSTSSFKETSSTFLSSSLKLFLKLSPTTPFIKSAFFITPSKSLYSLSHFAAVF